MAAGAGGRGGGFGFLYLEEDLKPKAMGRREGSSVPERPETEDRQHFPLPGGGGARVGPGQVRKVRAEGLSEAGAKAGSLGGVALESGRETEGRAINLYWPLSHGGGIGHGAGKCLCRVNKNLYLACFSCCWILGSSLERMGNFGVLSDPRSSGLLPLQQALLPVSGNNSDH